MRRVGLYMDVEGREWVQEVTLADQIIAVVLTEAERKQCRELATNLIALLKYVGDGRDTVTRATAILREVAGDD